MAYKNVLLIQLRQLGDILLTTPCIREIKRSDPTTKVTFLCHRMGRVVLNDNPYLDECFVYDEKRDAFSDYVRLLKALRQKKFDLVIDFMNNPRSALFALLSGGGKRLAFCSKRRFFYNQVVARVDAGAGVDAKDYIVEEKFRLLRAAGFAAKDASLTLPWFEIHTTPLLKLYSSFPEFKDAKVRVILSPTHRRAVRRWPLENFASLADYLVREWQAFVSWTWGPDEEQEIDRVMGLCREKTYKSPATTFREMAAVIANHDLFIGNSNGPSHVAVAAGIYSLQLHGPTRGESWSPANDKHQFLQGAGSIQAISVEAVKYKLGSFMPRVVEDRKLRSAGGLKLKWG